MASYAAIVAGGKFERNTMSSQRVITFKHDEYTQVQVKKGSSAGFCAEDRQSDMRIDAWSSSLRVSHPTTYLVKSKRPRKRSDECLCF